MTSERGEGQVDNSKEDTEESIRIPCLWVSVGKEPGEVRVALGSTALWDPRMDGQSVWPVGVEDR